jgi:hypothetical protein
MATENTPALTRIDKVIVDRVARTKFRMTSTDNLEVNIPSKFKYPLQPHQKSIESVEYRFFQNTVLLQQCLGCSRLYNTFTRFNSHVRHMKCVLPRRAGTTHKRQCEFCKVTLNDNILFEHYKGHAGKKELKGYKHPLYGVDVLAYIFDKHIGPAILKHYLGSAPFVVTPENLSKDVRFCACCMTIVTFDHIIKECVKCKFV